MNEREATELLTGLDDTIPYDGGWFRVRDHPEGHYIVGDVHGKHVVITDWDATEEGPYDITFYSSEQANMFGNRPLYRRSYLTFSGLVAIMVGFQSLPDPDAALEEARIDARY